MCPRVSSEENVCSHLCRMLFVNSGLQCWVGDLDFLCVGAKTIKFSRRKNPYIWKKKERKNPMNIKLIISQLMNVTWIPVMSVVFTPMWKCVGQNGSFHIALVFLELHLQCGLKCSLVLGPTESILWGWIMKFLSSVVIFVSGGVYISCVLLWAIIPFVESHLKLTVLIISEFYFLSFKLRISRKLIPRT